MSAFVDYEQYDALRAAAPVYETPFGIWLLTRYDDVRTALSDLRFSDSEQTWILNAFTLASFAAMFVVNCASRMTSAPKMMKRVSSASSIAAFISAVPTPRPWRSDGA